MPSAALLSTLLSLLHLATSQPSPDKIRQVELATEHERRAVQLNPQSAEAYWDLANAYRNHKFLRAASGALSVAVALSPKDADRQLELGTLLRRVGDPDGAVRALNAALALKPSPAAHLHLSFLASDATERERHTLSALALEPTSTDAYARLARIYTEKNGGQMRSAEAEAAWRSLMHLEPGYGGRKLFDFLRFADRKLEAAVAFKRAQALVDERLAASAAAAAAGDGSAPSAPVLSEGLMDWGRWVDQVERHHPPLQPKCLARACIQGLAAALILAEAGPHVKELLPDHLHPAAVAEMLGGPPLLLKRATESWTPTVQWDAAHLSTAAGREELEVTVVTHAESFEVRPDRTERPPKSTMLMGDYVRLLALKRDANRTLYSRQAPLWPMPGLLRDLAPLPWMVNLRIQDLNFWLGDGHFRNTLHNDPFDNFLCQVRGSKLVMLFPPEASDFLSYAPRRDIQANFHPFRGEYGRFDTGIVSHNTAAINGALPDAESVAAHPEYAKALKLRSYARLQPADCLYLPRGWHHHVFSEADMDSGYNLALNLWISREDMQGPPPREPASDEPHPTLQQIQASLAALDGPPSAATPSTGSGEKCNVDDG